jgi:hypothetical protein
MVSVDVVVGGVVAKELVCADDGLVAEAPAVGLSVVVVLSMRFSP